MVSNRSERPRLGLGLGLGLPIGPFGTCATLGLNLYTLPHEVVRRPSPPPISVLRGVLRMCKDRLTSMHLMPAFQIVHMSNHVFSTLASSSTSTINNNTHNIIQSYVEKIQQTC